MGWYWAELPLPPVIPILSLLFNFSEKMDTCRDIHWGVDYPQGERCYDHAHPWREVSMLEPKIP
jgi:hypothetical protein